MALLRSAAARMLTWCCLLVVLGVPASAQQTAQQQQQTATLLRAATLPNGKLNLTAIAEVGRMTLPVSAGGSMDGSSDLKVPILPTAVPRLQQILAEVVANAIAKSGNRSFGQDTERAAAAGFVVRRGTQFFKGGKPYYFVGGNAYWFIDFYTLDWGREKIEEFMDTCQALGVSVLRTWFFNLGMPKDFNRYDARQVAGMDYVIWAAKRRGLMLTLTMGNFWNAYRSPEDFLLWATGSLAGKDTLDFYGDPAARALYKLHIWGMLSRINPLTGLAPKDDPAIFSFNIINEPRCPGCFTPVQQATHQDFLRDIGAFMRAITPLHLISAGTEGFFVEDRQSMLHYYNPGPGAQCDGEDWFAVSASPYLDYATVHIYERHMELLPVPNEGNPSWPNWNFCDFECYVPWFRMYTQLHNYLAQNVLKKPVVIEEFGLTWFKKTPAQQRVLFKVAMDMLVASAGSNGALAGAMFWSAAHNDTVDWDGYNIRIDRPAYTQAASALPSTTSLPASMVSPEQAKAMTPDNRTLPIPPDVTFTEGTLATAPPALRAQMQVQPPARRANEAAAVARQTLPGTLPGAAIAAGTPTAATAGAAANASGVAAAANASGVAAAANASGVAASLAPSQAPAIQQVPVSSAAGASSGLPGAQQSVAVTRTASVQPTVTGRRLLGRAAQRLHVTSQQYSYSQQPGQQYSYTSPNRSGRQLLVLQDELDAFRRGHIREQCAQEAAADWRPYLLFNLTDDLTTNPRYSGLLQGGDAVAVISEASANLNRMRSEAPVQQFPVAQAQPQPGGATAAAVAAVAAAPAAVGGATAAAVLPAGGAAVQQLG